MREENGERMDYQSWEKSLPSSITGDVLWKVQAYRLALFAAEIGWVDDTKLWQDQRTRALSDHLYRALGSISADIAEGYSRSSGRDRAHFDEYALGSARESRGWYYKDTYSGSWLSNIVSSSWRRSSVSC